MKPLYLFLLTTMVMSACNKENPETAAPTAYAGIGFFYTDGDPDVVVDGLGYYYAESRGQNAKIYVLKKSELTTEYKNITIDDSIPVSIRLQETQTPVGCECIPPGYLYYHILSIQKR